MKIIILTIGICAFTNAFSQQEPSVKMHINLINNNDVYFNPKSFNPSLITDSSLIQINGGLQFDNVGKSFGRFFISTESDIKKIKSGFGLSESYSFNEVLDEHNVIFSYRYRFAFNENSGLKAGLNIGLKQYKLKPLTIVDGEDILVSEYGNKWLNNINISFGGAYYFKNHSFSLAYHNYNFDILRNPELKINSQGIIAGYAGLYRLSEKLLFIPELFGCLQNEREYGIFSLKVSYNKIVSFGLIYNTQNSFGSLLDLIILKRIGLSYHFNFNESVFNKYYLSHNFMIRFVY